MTAENIAVSSNERAAFEKWAESEGMSAERLPAPFTNSDDRNGRYQSTLTDRAWAAWRERSAVETTAGNWISLAYRLPDQGSERVLVATVTGKVLSEFPSDVLHLWGVAKADDDECYYTHWMAAPKPPGAAEKATACTHVRRKPSQDELPRWQCADCGAYL